MLDYYSIVFQFYLDALQKKNGNIMGHNFSKLFDNTCTKKLADEQFYIRDFLNDNDYSKYLVHKTTTTTPLGGTLKPRRHRKRTRRNRFFQR